jgi:hypothetical protein
MSVQLPLLQTKILPTFSVPLGTAVTYVGIWLMVVAFFSNPSSVPWSAFPFWRIVCRTQLTHLSYELGANSTDVIVREVKLRGDALGFC